MKNLLVLAIAFILVSCEEPYTIDQQQVAPSIVIEGLVTNQLTNHYIKINRTTDFYSTGATPRVSGAQVEVTDNDGNIFIYQEETPGVYYSEDPYQGIEGNLYRLSVVVDSKTYIAEEELRPVTSIDSLTYYLDEEQQRDLADQNGLDPDEEGRIYEVLLYTKEPQETQDYYLFKFYRDGELFNFDGEDVYYSDDEYLQENIDGVAFNEWYKLGEMAKIEMFSITRNAYLYYNDLDITLNNDGGLFSPLPSNPRSNITNGALGLFQVSAVVMDSVKIE
ncbi:MAG: DUF4249 domain-containing protein [Cyclobacteriaceae bacterium]